MAVRYALLTRDKIRPLRPGQKITEHGITAKKLGNGDVRSTVNVMVVVSVFGTPLESVTFRPMV